ncbi:P-loop containing nucleoside triphosphate hydrolase protein, partial [Mycena latifolia]
LPAQPKIFHGRDLELHEILKALHQDAARVAILGAGGMGKTSLARAALHHPTIVAKYDCRFFIPCDSVTSDIELATLIGTHLGLKPQKDLKKPIIQYFSRSNPCLLILDNLETPWEPRESRGEIEEFLSLLTDVPHLALLITMRGAERPGKVHWTHPFLPPLRPLSNEAARNIFIDIADGFHDSNDIDKILALTNNMPLVVDLIAHLVDHEGCESVLARWETEKTSVLSEGYDRRSNLDASIAISLSSPRITSLSGARDLLSLLSILPDGISDVELLQASLPIQDPLACKAALLGTSLAYSDDRKRFKALIPIREHIQKFSPPSIFLIQALQKHFSLL